MTYKSFLFSILFVIILSCENIENETSLVTIDPFSLPKAKLIDRVGEYEMIFLKYNSFESLVANVLKFEISKDYIYVLNVDLNEKRSIIIFNSDGDFVKRINTLNSDNLIDSEVLDFILDDNDELIVLDKKNNLVLLNKDFYPVRDLKLGVKAVSLSYNNGMVLSYSNNQALNFQPDSTLYDISIYSTKDQFSNVNKFDKIEIEEFTTANNSRIWGDIFPNENGFLFTKFLNDTIYQITDKVKFPKYVLDFGVETFRVLDFPDIQLDPFSPILTSEYSWGLSQTTETRKYLTFQFFSKSIPLGIIWNLNEKDGIIINPMDLIGDEDLIPFPKYYREGFYYGMLTEGDMSSEITSSFYSNNSIMFQVVAHLTDQSNPVIFKYTLK